MRHQQHVLCAAFGPARTVEVGSKVGVGGCRGIGRGKEQEYEGGGGGAAPPFVADTPSCPTSAARWTHWTRTWNILPCIQS
jgi:hypothetical protein